MDEALHQKLLALLRTKAKGKFTVDVNRVVHYSHDHEDLIGNDIICAVREEAFPSWQLVMFPAHWAQSYKDYMTAHDIPFREELRDGQLRLLIPRRYRPHSWKLNPPIAAPRRLKAVS